MQCGYYDERMWLSFLKWTSQKCSGPYAQTAQQVSSNTVYGILFPSSLNRTVSGAIGESEQSFKPFRLQIRYSKLQFIARSHSKITPFRWSVAFYSRAEGHSHSQKTAVTWEPLIYRGNHSSGRWVNKAVQNVLWAIPVRDAMQTFLLISPQEYLLLSYGSLSLQKAAWLHW